MYWLVLVLSGVLEAVWATALGRSEGFTRLTPTVVFAVGLAGSMAGLAYAMRGLPIGTAYAVWVGIGATLTAGRAETLRGEYATVYRARREHIAEHCRRLGWSFIPHRTDHLASEALVAVHGRLSGAPQAVAPRAAGASA